MHCTVIYRKSFAYFVYVYIYCIYICICICICIVYIVYVLYISYFLAGEIADMSLHILKALMAFKLQHLPDRKINVRIGMHTGPCCAGR